jgi:ATP-grasp domain, R2K clade family 2
MPTLILTPRFTEDAQALWRAAVQIGWQIERLTSWHIPDKLRSVNEPVLYLESLFAPTLAEQFGLRLLEPADNWLPQIPEEFRKRRVSLTTLIEARKLNEPIFVKPPNDKSFPARIYTGSELPEEYDDNSPVLIAEIVSWQKEFRCFVLDRQIRDISVYLRDGKLQRDKDFEASEMELLEAKSFAERVLDDARIDIPKATVLDVGVIEGRGWAVVEQNAAWGAGIYGCNPVEVLEVLRYAAVPA